ncbi:MAG: hypothetical protein KF910_03715 [Brevundimonas sp.]|uniref:hypothetical protein n=1 Tax=Brevundimonas sp. TaxID=1871086 RepID=UPI0025BCE1A0|nr:hypothetical protein [Brevundimonas sp.]MBX3476687.1 hypothetical protein [Brevundimonas sp.]
MESPQSDSVARIAAGLDLRRSDAWAGIRTALNELERRYPGSIARMNAELEMRRLGVDRGQ